MSSLYTYLNIYIHIYVSVMCIFVHTYLYAHPCLPMYMSVHTHPHMHKLIHSYIHIHRLMHVPPIYIFKYIHSYEGLLRGRTFNKPASHAPTGVSGLNQWSSRGLQLSFMAPRSWEYMPMAIPQDHHSTVAQN